MKIKGVIFDLDGTLANTLEDLKDSLNMAMSDLSLPLHDNESVIRCLNNGMKVFIRRAVPEELRTDELLEQVSQKYHHYYSLNHMNKTYFYDGINELLDCLKHRYGLKLAVLSNKDNLYTQNIVKTLDINNAIDAAYGFREGIPHKPSPEGVFDIMKQLGLQKQETVFVGDSSVDVETAANAELKSVGVLWGFKGMAAFTDKKPDYIIEKPMDLVNILQEMK